MALRGHHRPAARRRGNAAPRARAAGAAEQRRGRHHDRSRSQGDPLQPPIRGAFRDGARRGHPQLDAQHVLHARRIRPRREELCRDRHRRDARARAVAQAQGWLGLLVPHDRARRGARRTVEGLCVALRGHLGEKARRRGRAAPAQGAERDPRERSHRHRLPQGPPDHALQPALRGDLRLRAGGSPQPAHAGVVQERQGL